VIAYRIARTEHVRDMSGSGSRIHGGRWNPKGTSVLYTSESRSLAALELYANRARVAKVRGFSVAKIVIPDKATIKKLTLADLPKDWNRYPAPVELANIGAQWVGSGETLVLSVPSVLVYQERNYLINPAHPEMVKVRIDVIEEYVLDRRLIPDKHKA